MSSKSSSSSSSKSFIARCGRDAEGGEHHVSSRIVYIHIDFSHEIVSNSLSLIKKRDHLAKKKEDIKKTLHEREKNRKTQQTLFFSILSYRHDVSFALVHEFDRHAHAFPVETDVIVGAHDDRPTNSFLTTIKKRRRSKKNAFKRRRRFFLYCLGFLSLGFVSS